MQAHGVSGRLLPLVILTELGGGQLVLFGFKTRWAAIALFDFCLLTGAFFHTGAEQAVQLQKNIAMAGGFLALALLGPRAWSLDGWRGEPSSEGYCRGALPIVPRGAIDLGVAATISYGQVGSDPILSLAGIFVGAIRLAAALAGGL
jgi:hypothetical protein